MLVITYYWPPSGGITVLRCLKIVKYLRDFGWEPVVYTAENAHYPSLDPSNLRDIPEGLEVIRGRIWEPYALYKKFTGQAREANVNNVFYTSDEEQGAAHRLAVWIRSNFFIPDARARWIRPSVRRLMQYLKEHPVDALFSDGPPHTNTRIATLIKQKTGIPWLADFQDPWTQVDYYQLLRLMPWADRKHHRLEQEAFAAADKITIVSPTWREELMALGAQNVSVIPWGFDPDDFPPTPVRPPASFSLAHIGIMGYDRNPRQLFRALARLKTNYPALDQELELRFAGQIDHSVRASLEEAGLAPHLHFLGTVPREEALQLARESAVLLLLINQQPNAQGRIPGKAFEYLAARRPILSLGPPHADVSRMIEEVGAGRGIAYEAEDALYRQLEEWYLQYRAGRLQAPLDTSIEQYSIRNLTRRMAGFLDEIAVHADA